MQHASTSYYKEVDSDTFMGLDDYGRPIPFRLDEDLIARGFPAYGLAARATPKQGVVVTRDELVALCAASKARRQLATNGYGPRQF